ncbi:MAG TPA: putative Ig domain-containing protein, partial [Planctomycetota bacterium]|nr:putative Ig domain-containing protein [Planctomycetota bacterium]
MGFIRWTRGNVLGRALFLVMAGALVPACGGGGGGGGGGTPGLPTGLYITVTSLPSGTNGGVYTSTTLTAANGTAPYTFSLLSGSLPPGLTLTAGTISGTPTIDGSFSFKIRVTDAKNRVADQLFVITVTGGTASALVLSSTSPLPGATQNSAYLFALSATGGLQPYTWTVTAGSLPPGMSLNLNSGTLSGTPTGPTAGFTVTVTDSTSPVAQTASKAFTLAVNSPISVTALLAAATLNSAYSHTPTFSGGTAPFDWSLVSGTLPPGLTISAAGLISGTPTATGVFSFVLIVTDATGASVTTGMNIQVNTGITITTSSLPPDTINISYGSVPINASGGTLPYTTWAVTGGGLPPGISLNAATGFLTGTPTGTGSFPVTITVTDSAGATASSTGLTIQINPVPVITSSSLPPDTQGINYNQQLTTTPGTGTGFLTFSLQGGSILPAGITLSPSGLLSGIPSAPYNSTFNVIVTDSVGAVSAPVNFGLVINGPPVVTNNAPTADTVGALYPGYTPAMTGGTLPI